MDTSASSLSIKHAFEQFLEGSSFVRRTRESYAEDLKPLLAQVGQKPLPTLTDGVIQPFLITQESLAPAMYNRCLTALRSFIGFLQNRGWITEALLEGDANPKEHR